MFSFYPSKCSAGVPVAKWVNKRKIEVFFNMYISWETPRKKMRNSQRGMLEFCFKYHLQLNQRNKCVGESVTEAIRKSEINKSTVCYTGFN